MPMIDPIGTGWVYEDAIHGFASGASTPRRAAIVSITRSSRRLLRLVDAAQREHGRSVVSEATLETFALLHGLKAVAVPQPIYFGVNNNNNNNKDGDGKGQRGEEMRAARQLAGELNRGPPHSRAGGATPSMLYAKTGWVQGPWWEASYWFTGGGAENLWKEYLEGRRLPPMLLHPVKEK